MKQRLLVIVLLLVLAGGVAWFWKARQSHPEDGQLRLYGNVDIREVALGFRVAGRLAEVLVDEGDAVKQGATLAKLDPGPMQSELNEAKGRVESTRARLQLLETGSRPQEIAQAKAVVREREVALQNAERLYKRQEELFANKTVSVQERDDAQANYHEAEARLNSAREQLNLLTAGFREEEVAQAKAELERARAALESAQLRLQDTVLAAPADGIVLTRAQEPGAVLQMGAPVLTLSLQRPVWVRAYINEPDLGRVRPGLPVRVSTDTRKDHFYSGVVGYVSPRAEFTPKPVETPELRTTLVYRLRIVVNDPDDALRQGMPVTVSLSSP